jgi:hypothetical protein
MKITFFVILIEMLSCFLKAQDLGDYNIHQIGSTEGIVLESVLKSTISGGTTKNRNKRLIQLPPMTEYVIIRLQIDNKKVEEERQNIQYLINNLENSKIGPEFKLGGGIILGALKPPQNGFCCDFYMFPDRLNFDAFTTLKKGFNNYDDKWKAYVEPFRILQTDGFVLLIDIQKLIDKNNLYVGFKNNYKNDAIKIFLDVVALIGNGWNKELKEKLYDSLYQSFIESGQDKNESRIMAACIIEKLTSEYSTEDFNKIPKYELGEKIKALTIECVKEMENNSNKIND